MPLSSPITASIFNANLAANAMVGISTPQLAMGLALGLELYANTGLIVTSIDSGTAGTGTGIGVGVFVSPPVLSASFFSSFTASSIIGPFSPFMINALAQAFSLSLQQAIVQTFSSSVGIGAGVTTLIPNSGSSISAWTAGFAAAGMVGPTIPQLVSAVSLGFDQAASSAIGAVAIAGSPSIVPSAGVGFGKLL